MTKSATGLMELPAEMITAIAEAADAYDLLAFRTTCKALAAASHDAFVRSWFTTRTHLYTPDSLQVLGDISAEDHLAKHTREVVLVVRHPEHDKTARIMPKAQQDLYSYEGPANFELVVRILDRFVASGYTPGIVLNTGEGFPLGCHGVTTLWAKLRKHEARHPRAYITMKLLEADKNATGQVSSDLLTAILKTNSPVQQLSLCEAAVVHGLSSCDWSVDELYRSGRFVSFAFLRSLSVCSSSFDTLITRYDYYDMETNAFNTPSWSTPCLEELVLTGVAKVEAYWMCDEGYCFLIQALGRSPLKSLEIRSLRLSHPHARNSESLPQALSYVKHKLERIVLSDNVLASKEHWGELTQWLRQGNMTQLKKLRLSGMRYFEGSDKLSTLSRQISSLDEDLGEPIMVEVDLALDSVEGIQTGLAKTVAGCGL